MKSRDPISQSFEYFSYVYKGVKGVAYCQEGCFIRLDINYRRISKNEFDRFYEEVSRKQDLLEMDQRQKLSIMNQKGFYPES